MSSSIAELSDIFFFFFFNDTATTEIYTLSLHDALPIFRQTPEAPQAQLLVLPRQGTAERLVDRSEQLTCALRSGHTLRVATLVEISQRNVRQLRPRVIPLAPLQVEAAQAL